MKTIAVAFLAGILLFSVSGVCAAEEDAFVSRTLEDLGSLKARANLPEFTKEPFLLAVDHILFPSRIHSGWPLLPWAIFFTNEVKRNFIGIYYDETAIRYAEWVTDTDNGPVIRCYWFINGAFVFGMEIPRPEETPVVLPPTKTLPDYSNMEVFI